MERPLLGSLELQQAPRPWLQEESHKTVCALSNPITSTLQVPRTSEDMKKGACLSPLPLSLICPSCNARALQGLLFMLWGFFFHILITFYFSNCSRKTGKTNCFREPHFCDFCETGALSSKPLLAENFCVVCMCISACLCMYLKN